MCGPPHRQREDGQEGLGTSTDSLRKRYHRGTFVFEVRFEAHVQPVGAPRLGSPCHASWARKCALPLPTPNGTGIAGAFGSARHHLSGQCPCFCDQYGGPLHRWCTGGWHYKGAWLHDKRNDGLAAPRGRLLPGMMQTRITDFYRRVTGPPMVGRRQQETMNYTGRPVGQPQGQLHPRQVQRVRQDGRRPASRGKGPEGIRKRRLERAGHRSTLLR